MQTYAATDPGERKRLGVIVAVVLAFHGLAVMRLWMNDSRFDATAMPRVPPVDIRIVATVEPARVAAAPRAAPSADTLHDSPALAKNAARPRVARDSRASMPVQDEPAHDRLPPRGRGLSRALPSPGKPVTRVDETAFAHEPSTQKAAPQQPEPDSSIDSDRMKQDASSPAEKSAQQDRPAPEPASAGDTVSEPSFNAAYLRNPAPAYPPVALQRRWEGTVQMKVRVLASGRAEQVTVVASSGHASLDDAAVAAVSDWRFVPARRAGQAIDGWVQVPVVFKLGA